MYYRETDHLGLDAKNETEKQLKDSTHNNRKQEDDLAAQEARVKSQYEKIRMLKNKNAEKSIVEKETLLLESLRKDLKVSRYSINEKPAYTRCRNELENLARRRSIFFPSFEIYGSTAGLYDFGPPGCALKIHLEAFWRQFFVIEDDLLEINATCVTPHPVLKASGHVDRFCDMMVCDTVSGDCYRADKLLEDFISLQLAKKQNLTASQVDHYESLMRQCAGFNAEQLHDIFKEEKIKAPETGNPMSYPFAFNLMFKTQCGPKSSGAGKNDAYMRPETAQGIFVNFKRLLEYNAGKLPFGVAQQGLGFRNEISPRNGLLRVREFPMAEIEYFIDPLHKTHAKFRFVEHLRLPLFSKTAQMTHGRLDKTLNLREAVNQEIIQNECLAYFMGRAYLFITECGISPAGIRFRQHLESEKAHYARDCWDLDIETSYGWIECVGIADRSAYDLLQHSTACKTPLVSTRRYKEPKTVRTLQAVFNNPLLGRTFKKELSDVTQALENKMEPEMNCIEEQLQKYGTYTLHLAPGREVSITRDMVFFKYVEKTVFEETFIPNVIEPSFGIGRLLYCILEHTFRIRSTEDRSYLALPVTLAPVKCCILPISQKFEFNAILESVSQDLKRQGISCKVDVSGASIGKRYARTDEIGICYAVTIDFQSLEDNTITLRERDTMEQIRLPVDDVGQLMKKFVENRYTWEEACVTYSRFYTKDVNEA